MYYYIIYHTSVGPGLILRYDILKSQLAARFAMYNLSIQSLRADF